MKKYLLLFISFSFLFLNKPEAQINGRFKNEWIRYNQQYLRMVVLTKGIYRISKAQIESQGFGVGANPEKLQLFHRGEEIAINVDGQTPSTYNFIEFYAMNNDGLQDSAVYYPKTARFNENYSIYADSTTYFLTVGANNGKRITNTTAVNTGTTADNYFLSKALINYNTEWNQDIATSILPPATQSYFEPHEGLCSIWYFLYNDPPDLANGTVTPPLPVRPFIAPLPITNYEPSVSIPINYEALIVSRNNLTKNIAYTIGNSNPVSGNIALSSFNSTKLNTSISSITGTSIPVNMNITTNPGINDFFSLAYQKAKYPRSLAYSDNLEIETAPKITATGRIRLSGANAGALAYDFTDYKNQKKISTVFNGDNSIDLSFDLSNNGTPTSKNIWVSHTPKTPFSMRVVNFTQIVQANYDYLIVTDPRLRTGAEAYKAYREGNNGLGPYKVLIKYTQDLYDEFSFGERNPIAIRRFADYMTSTPAKMKYLFLLGKAYSQTSAVKGNALATSRAKVDFAPTFGNPGSDNLLTAGLLGLPFNIPAIPTGRLSVGVNDVGAGGNSDPAIASTAGTALSIADANQEILNYLEKVNLHEHKTDIAWQKNFLNVVGPKSGGINGLGGEYSTLQDVLEEMRQIAVAAPYAHPTNYSVFNKPISAWNGTEYSETYLNQTYYDNVNNGVGIINYFGHGTGASTSNNIGFVSREAFSGVKYPGKVFNDTTKYYHKGKYPLLVAMGCGISNSYQRDPSLTDDWLKTPNKGAINAIGQSTISYESYDEKLLRTFYKTWFGNLPSAARKSSNSKVKATSAMVNGAIGDIVKQSLINLYNDPLSSEGDPTLPGYDIIFGASLQQTILSGDPAIQILAPIIQPLSLTLLEVKAVNEEKIIKLFWKTENEINFNKFEVERSNDLKKFEKISEVQSNNNSQEVSEYSIDDKKPNLGMNYYRLKMIDLDGSFQYSKIVSSLFEDADNKLIVSENPIKNGQFDVKMANIVENSIKVYDVKGNQINIKKIVNSSDFINISSEALLNKGIYILEAYNKFGIKQSIKIISK